MTANDGRIDRLYLKGDSEREWVLKINQQRERENISMLTLIPIS